MLLAGNAQRIYIERSRVEIKRQCLGVRTERLQKSTQRRRVGWGKLKRGGTAGNKGSVPWSVWATQPSCSTPIHPASLNPKSPPYSWRFWNNSKMELLPHNALPKPLPSHKTKKCSFIWLRSEHLRNTKSRGAGRVAIWEARRQQENPANQKGETNRMYRDFTKRHKKYEATSMKILTDALVNIEKSPNQCCADGMRSQRILNDCGCLTRLVPSQCSSRFQNWQLIATSAADTDEIWPKLLKPRAYHCTQKLRLCWSR